MTVGNIIDTIDKIFAGFAYLISADYSTFHCTFPNTYWLLFFIIRVIPVLLLLLLITRAVAKRTKLKTDSLANLATFFCQPALLFFLMMVLAVVLRVWYCTTPLSFTEGDAACRMEIARDWLNSPQGIPGGLIWPPFYFFLLMIPSYLGFDLISGSRFITVLLGVLSLPVLYLLAKDRFGKWVALMACLLLAINPFHIKYSIISMTEVPFLFFLLLGMYFLFRFISTEKFLFLVLSSVCLNCSSGIRFEGWIVSALLPLFIIYYKKGWKFFFAYGAMNAISIIAYMLVSLKTTGHLVYGLYISDLEVQHNYEQVKDAVPHILNGLNWDKVLPYWMFIFVLHGIWLALKNRKELPWLFTACVLFGMISWKVITGTNEPSWRYFSTGLFLLLPFIAASILHLLPKNASLKTAVVLFGITFFCVRVSEQYQLLKEQPYIPPGLLAVADWMRAHKKPGEKYLFNSSGTEFAPMRVYTNTVMDDMYFPPYSGMKKFDNYTAFTDSVFLRTVRTRGYKYMVYQTGLAMDSVFHLPQVQQQLKTSGPQFDSVYAGGNFRVYLIGH